jgi:hypothetical protein
MTNCRNCGAPIDRDRRTCPYCDTPYAINKDVRNTNDEMHDLYLAAIKAYRGNAITVNECRRLIGVRERLESELMDVDFNYRLAYTAVDGHVRLK